MLCYSLLDDGEVLGELSVGVVAAPARPEPLEIGDEQALMMKEEQTKTGRSKARPAVSWLRRTEYMGTDLYDAVHKVRG